MTQDFAKPTIPEAQTVARSYEAPRLVAYGTLKSLTASGSLMMPEMTPEMPMMALP